MQRPLRYRMLSLVVAAAALAGCATTSPSLHSDIARLQSNLTLLRADSEIAGFADPELRDAEHAVAILAADGRRMSREEYDQSLYLADRLVQIAEAEGRARAATHRVTELGETREQLLLDAREREALDARHQAVAARDAAELARLEAEAANNAAALAQREAESARLQAFHERNDAEDARKQAQRSQQTLLELQSKLIDLQTRQTARGLVVTLSDVLFEFDRATLKPGATRELDELVKVLKENEGSTVSIEGHTDSLGAHAYNVELSQQRADAVRDYLITGGIASNRIAARGLGPDFPVASNGDVAGRQQNRRVEVVIRDPSGS